MTRHVIGSLALTLLVPLTGAAQSEAPPAAPTQGPMIIERVHGGWLAAPDVKITDISHSTGTIVGGYGGWLTDSRLFIGGGGYWLAHGANNLDLGYGGVIVGWLGGVDEKIGFGAKVLLGWGQATQNAAVISPVPTPYADPPNVRNPDGRSIPNPQPPIATSVRFHQDLFVAEPEFNVIVHLAQHLRLTGGVGYRFMDNYNYYNYGYYYPNFDNHLSGVTGTVALQIGGGF